MQRSFVAVCLFSLITALSVPGVAQAPPSADAYVTRIQPDANFGSSPFLPVQEGTTSYIRVNLGVLPANSVILKATLRLYVNAVALPGSFDVYQVDGPWSEQAVKMNNAPPLGSSATGGRSAVVTAASRNQFLLIDITPLAQAWANASIPNYGVALVLSSSTGSFSFDSKESTGTGHQPELEVVLASPAGIPTASTLTPGVGAPDFRANVPGISDPYVDNSTALQAGANFNIAGSGSASSFNATSRYLLAGTPAFGINGTSSLFVGPRAGNSNTGPQNTFVGVSSGQANTTGNNNSFMGTFSGFSNATGTNLTFVGIQSGYFNTVGNYNSFVGGNSGYSNTTGSYNVFMGNGSGRSNTTGSFLTFLGMQSGLNNTTGKNNSFIGTYSGLNNTAGSSNTFVGYNAGLNANPAASNNVYISSLGASGDSGTIRIGDPANQTSAYIAGIFGRAPSGALPVVVNANGQLGTTTAGIGVTSFNGRNGAVVPAANDYSFSQLSGSVSFTQVTGSLTGSQLTGTYPNPLVLSNATNVVAGSFNGTFTGNGAGLTGVVSGLNWPVVTKNADYALQISDFATPTKHGNYIVHIGTLSHKFTLPNPPPPNGSCVAIGNVADAGINSGTNVYLHVNPNGLLVDNSATFPTMPRRSAYLYCSDGSAGYYRLGFNQNGVSEIGPWLETLDTGTVNAYKTTFRNGMDFDLATGSMIFLLVQNANTASLPTLDVNGLGAKKILKYGNQALAPGDLSPTAYALLIYDGQAWEVINPQTTRSTLTGTTGSIGGTALSAGTCTAGTAAVTGATVGHPVSVSSSDGSLPNGLVVLSAAVTNSNVVTVQLCAVAAVTPPANTYNVATQ